MARRLRIDAAHVITGHTHRGGPHEGEADWPLPGGGRLHNTGSWVFPPPSTTPAPRPAPTGRGRSPGSRTAARRGAVRLLDDLAPDRARASSPSAGRVLADLVARRALGLGLSH